MTAEGPQSDGVPVTWTPPPEAEGGGPDSSVGNGRRLGFPASVVDALITLVDDPEVIDSTIADGDPPFNGAYVPMVIHDPLLAERSSDAVEWGAELIRGAGGRQLVVTPCAEVGTIDLPINPRQWNHAAAMIERLEGICGRFGVELVVRDVVEEAEVRDVGILDPDRPIAHLLDAGRFLSEHYRPLELTSPGREVGGGGVIDRVRSLLRDRT